MGITTGIEWCHHTWSPWWGCTKVSSGCKNCYADSWSNRWGFKIWGQNADRRFFGDKHWNEPIHWNRQAAELGERRRVFPSMCDPFEDRPDLVEPRARFLELIKATPCLDWMLLTKRPENIARLLPDGFLMQPFPPNMWFGFSAEDQKTFDERWDHFEAFARAWQPAVTFISLEPLIGPVDPDRAVCPVNIGDEEHDVWTHRVNGIIVGGESKATSPKSARPMNPDWVRSIRDRCLEESCEFFFKQWGEWLPFEESAQPPFWNGQDGCTIDRHRFPDLLLRSSDHEPVREESDDASSRGIGYTWWAPELDGVVYRLIGKKLAGCQLDGRKWQSINWGGGRS